MLDFTSCRGLVLDTSVWINLLATEAMDSILGALAISCHAPEQVVMEIRRHPATGLVFSAGDHPLRHNSRNICVSPLEERELELFVEMVGAPAVDALGDGEAAAIAMAISRDLDLVIDDRKARRISRARVGHARIHWTVDLLRAPAVINMLGGPFVDDCIEKARRIGRMHVPRVQ